MRLLKSIQLAFNILLHSKLRSWLTIIGIIVGIAAVVSIISVSMGAQQQMEAQMSKLGADVLTISPGVQKAFGGGFGGDRERSQVSVSSEDTKNLTERDAIVLRGISNVKYAMGSVSGKADISFSGKSVSMSVTGVDPAVWKEITSETVGSGRLLSNGDVYSAVIGSRVAESVFGKTIPLNSKIVIGGKSFNVVGILKESNGFGGGSSVYIPIDPSRTLLEDVGTDEYNSISVKIRDVTISNQTVIDITNKLMLSRGILKESKKDFTVTNPASMQATMEATLSTITLFLGAIAAISLIVGAIGIANTMFTSVLEKTKEIGIMKAIGTRNEDIMKIFLLNSGFIGLIGGIGGVIVGAISSTAINTLAGVSTSSSVGGPGGRGMLGAIGGSSVLSIQLILGSILFAVVIGMISGAIPAYRASKLNPVDALRYE